MSGWWWDPLMSSLNRLYRRRACRSSAQMCSPQKARREATSTSPSIRGRTIRCIRAVKCTCFGAPFVKLGVVSHPIMTCFPPRWDSSQGRFSLSPSSVVTDTAGRQGGDGWRHGQTLVHVGRAGTAACDAGEFTIAIAHINEWLTVGYSQLLPTDTFATRNPVRINVIGLIVF